MFLMNWPVKTTAMFVGAMQQTAPRWHIAQAPHGHIPFAELFCQRPNGKYTDTHRNTADDRNHGLCDTVVVASQDIVTEINQPQVFQAASDCVDQKIEEDNQGVFVSKNNLQLRQEGNLSFFLSGRFFRHTFFREIIFYQGQRQREN